MRTVAPPPWLIHYCRRKPITPAQPYKMRTVAPPPWLIHYCRRKPITPAQPYKRTVAIYLKGCRLSLQECQVPSFSNSHFRHISALGFSANQPVSPKKGKSTTVMFGSCFSHFLTWIHWPMPT